MATAELNRTIELENIGPVEHLTLPVPAQGGVVVIRGRNGRGKTKTLDAVQSLATGKGKLEPRDGTLAGRVEGFGATIKVGRSTRRTGELEVVSLEGRLSIADLVDPGMVDPGAADNARIKALVQLTGTKANPALFYDLVENGREEFDALVPENPTDDLIVLASHVKRKIEAAARTEEHAAENADSLARAHREQFAEVDLTAPHDVTALQQRLQEATLAQDRLVNLAKTSRDAHDRAIDAETAIREAREQYSGPTIEAATEAVKHAQAAANARRDEMVAARDALAAAQKAFEHAETAYVRADSEVSASLAVKQAAESHESTLAKWKEQASAALPNLIGQAELTDAQRAVDDARAAIEQGIKVAAAIHAKAKHEDARETAKQHRKRAESLREAASGVDGVLSEVVTKAGVPLLIKDGRLICETKRGETFFADLSMGERWKIALDIAIECVGEHGLITLPQEAWEALDPINRGEIAKHVEGRGVVVLTAEASDNEELEAEVYAAS